MYVQDVAGGKPRAFTPPISVDAVPDLGAKLVSPDGTLAFARDLHGKGSLYPLGGGQPLPVTGLAPQDLWCNWSTDGHSAYVYQDEKTHAQMFRIELSTGKRQLVTTLAPADPAGLVGIEPVRITPDGKSFGYSDNRSLSDLFLVDGVR